MKKGNKKHSFDSIRFATFNYNWSESRVTSVSLERFDAAETHSEMGNQMLSFLPNDINCLDCFKLTTFE